MRPAKTFCGEMHYHLILELVEHRVTICFKQGITRKVIYKASIIVSCLGRERLTLVQAPQGKDTFYALLSSEIDVHCYVNIKELLDKLTAEISKNTTGYLPRYNLSLSFRPVFRKLSSSLAHQT
jgi:hypothetical protein